MNHAESQAEVIARRLLGFAASVIRMMPRLSRTMAGRHIGRQLMRSSSSCGANYLESRAAESRADFLHKLQITLKELRESEYWLRLLAESDLVPSSDLTPLLKEADEMIRIIAKAVVSTKGKETRI